MNKKIIMKIFSLFLVIIWLIIIFVFSNMNVVDSNNQSKGLLKRIVETTCVTLEKIGIIEEKDDNDIQMIVEKLNMPLRKIAHFSVYLILSLLLLWSFNKLNLNINNKNILILLICFIYACLDEYHQTFISGRTGQFLDVLIDTSGGITGIIGYNLFIIRKNKKNSDK